MVENSTQSQQESNFSRHFKDQNRFSSSLEALEYMTQLKPGFCSMKASATNTAMPPGWRAVREAQGLACNALPKPGKQSQRQTRGLLQPLLSQKGWQNDTSLET